jgi:hypothetical protein
MHWSVVIAPNSWLRTLYFSPVVEVPNSGHCLFVRGGKVIEGHPEVVQRNLLVKYFRNLLVVVAPKTLSWPKTLYPRSRDSFLLNFCLHYIYCSASKQIIDHETLRWAFFLLARLFVGP